MFFSLLLFSYISFSVIFFQKTENRQSFEKLCVCVFLYAHLSSRRAILCLQKFRDHLFSSSLFTYFLSLYKYKEIQQTFRIELSVCFVSLFFPNFSKPTKQKRVRARARTLLRPPKDRRFKPRLLGWKRGGAIQFSCFKTIAV